MNPIQVFKSLFDAVINEKHLGFGPNDKHPPPDLDANKVGDHVTSSHGGQATRYRNCRTHDTVSPFRQVVYVYG